MANTTTIQPQRFLTFFTCLMVLTGLRAADAAQTATVSLSNATFGITNGIASGAFTVNLQGLIPSMSCQCITSSSLVYRSVNFYDNTPISVAFTDTAASTVSVGSGRVHFVIMAPNHDYVSLDIAVPYDQWGLPIGTFALIGGQVDYHQENGQPGHTAADNLKTGSVTISGDTLPALMVTTTSLPKAKSNQAYSVTVTAAGGTLTGYTWSIASGHLPQSFFIASSGVLSYSGLAATPAGTYTFAVMVSDSSNRTAIQSLVLIVDPASPFCPAPGTAISNVVLPALSSTYAPMSSKAIRFSYDSITLTFTTAPPSLSALCSASAENTLPVHLTIISAPFVFNGMSHASVTVQIVTPGSLSTMSYCDFSTGAVVDRCVLNGPYSASSYYAVWSTPGFHVTGPGDWINSDTGPPTYFVDLDRLNIVVSNSTMEAVLRDLEPYIHRTLITNLPKLPGSPWYTAFQDPGTVAMMVTEQGSGLRTGTMSDGGIVTQMSNSFVYMSATTPAAILVGSRPGTYIVLITATTSGLYNIQVTTGSGNLTPVATQSLSGTLTQGFSVAYQVNIRNTSAGMVQAISLAPPVAGDVNGDQQVDCNDLTIVKAAFGKRTGQDGFLSAADINADGVVDIRDLSFVAQGVKSGVRCQ